MSRSGRNPKSPAFQFYPGDFLADPKVQAMTAEQIGIYMLLLCAEWLDGPLPDDHDMLAGIGRVTRERFEDGWKAIGRCFRPCECKKGHIENPRMERERTFQKEGRDRRLAASKVAVEARIVHESSTDRATVAPLTLHPTPEALNPTPVSLHPRPETRSPANPVAEDKPRRERAQPTGAHPLCIKHWVDEWARTRLGTKATIQAKDGAAVAWMLKQHPDDPGEVQRRMTAMLEDPDPWMAQNASLPLLRSKWDRFAVTIRPQREQTGIDAARNMIERQRAEKAYAQ